MKDAIGPLGRIARRSAHDVVAAVSVAAIVGLSSAAAGQSAVLVFDLYAQAIRVNASAGTAVRAELYGLSGLRARAMATASANGVALLPWDPVEARGDRTTRPGDRVVVIMAGERITSTVPMVSARVSDDRLAIEGLGPPGAVVSAVADEAPSDPTPTQVVAGDGRVHLPIDLRGGAGLGSLILATGPARISLPVAPFDARVLVHGIGTSGRASAGTRVVVAAELPGPTIRSEERDVAADRAWEVRSLGADVVLSAGVPITLSERVTGLEPRVVAGIVPVLEVEVDADGAGIFGRAPAGASLDIILDDREGTVRRRTATADADGRFQLPLGPAGLVHAGWRVRVEFEQRPGLRFVAEVVFQRLTVVLYGDRIRGVADEPGVTVNIRLLHADQSMKAAGSALASSVAVEGRPKGSFTFRLVDASIEPGDVLEIDWHVGDPERVTIPRVVAHADPSTDVVSGEAPPGTELLVGIGWGADRRYDLDRVQPISPDGTFAITYQPDVDITLDGQTSSGPLVLRLPQGVAIESTWAVASLLLSADGEVLVQGPPGRAVVAVLTAEDGNVVGRAEGATAAAGELGRRTGWRGRFANVLSELAVPRAGERVAIAIADDSLAFEVPPLRASVDVARDRLVGVTAPKSTVVLGIVDLIVDQKSVIADEQGAFELDLSGEHDVRYNEEYVLAVRLPDERLGIEHWGHGAGLTLDMDRMVATGGHEPLLRIDAALERAGARIAAGSAFGSPDGAFMIALASMDGAVEPTVRGDVLRAVAQGAAVDPVLVLDVPEFSIEPDTVRRALTGRATPQGAVEVFVDPTFARNVGAASLGQVWFGARGERAAPVPIADDGTLDFVFPPTDQRGPDFRPGQRFNARYVLPSGHDVWRRAILPLANVEVGGARLCGFGRAGDVASFRLERGGRTAGTATARVGNDARFDGLWRDDLGGPVAAQPGDVVSGTIGSKPIVMPLRDIRISTTWRMSRVGQSGTVSEISGLVAPGADAYVTHPAIDCFAGLHAHGEEHVGIAASSSGRLTYRPAELLPGTSVELAVFSAEGHRMFAHADRVLGRAHVGLPRVSGLSVPMSSLEVGLLAPDGTPRATARGRVGPFGQFDVAFGEGGREITIQAGDQVVITSTTGSESFYVEDLAFDFSPRLGLVGKTSPGGFVQILLDRGDTASHAFPLSVGADGVFRLAPEDLPGGLEWSLADVTRIRVVRRVPSGHEVVVESASGIDPRPLDPMVYLPLSFR